MCTAQVRGPCCRTSAGCNMPVILEAIQKAYYQQAKNPSEDETLIELAGQTGLDAERFRAELNSPQVEQLLQSGFSFKQLLGIQGFPALVLEKDEKYYALTTGYTKADVVLERLNMVI